MNWMIATRAISVDWLSRVRCYGVASRGSAGGLKDSVGSEEGGVRWWDEDDEDGEMAIVGIF